MEEAKIDEKVLSILKNAFRDSLKNHIGPLEGKPARELQAWVLALLAVGQECGEQLKFLDEWKRDWGECDRSRSQAQESS